MAPFLSIVTVCRNSEKTISRTMQSVLEQDCTDYEYIIVDGGSEDATVTVIREWAGRFRSRGISIAYSSERDSGIYDAMNKGISRARGEVVGIINSDDWYERGAFSQVRSAAEVAPAAAVYYGFMRVVFKGRELLVCRYNFDTFLLDLESGVYTSGQHAACFVRRSAYEQVGVFDTAFEIAADYDLLIRLAKGGFGFRAVDATLANFSRGGASDRMRDHSRFTQRYAIWWKNGLISEREYRRRTRQTRYTYLKEAKTRIVSRLFSFK